MLLTTFNSLKKKRADLYIDTYVMLYLNITICLNHLNIEESEI